MAWSKLTIGLVLALLPVAASAAPGENRVAVLEAKPIDLPGLGPRALRESVVDGIKAQSAVAVDGEPGLTPDRLATCNTIECYQAVAAATGATYVLRIDGTFADDRYELQIVIWSQRTGQVVTSDRDRCKLCLADDMLRIARNQTAYVLDKAFAVTVSAPAAEPPSKTSRDLVIPDPNIPPDVQPKRSYRTLGWTLVASGAVVAAIGGVFWIENGRDRMCAAVTDGEKCWTESDTAKIGIPLVAIGAVIAGAGGIVLYVGSRKSSPITVGATTNGMAVGGRF